MSDLQKYKAKRKKKNPKFWAGYQKRFETFELGVLLKQARQNAGLTQDDIQLSEHACTAILSSVERHIGKEGGVRGIKGQRLGPWRLAGGGRTGPEPAYQTARGRR